MLRRFHTVSLSVLGHLLGSESLMFRRSAFLFGISVASGAILLSANLILSRWLGPESFGGFKTVTSLAGLLVLLADLGIGATLLRYGAEFARTQTYKLKGFIQSLLAIRALQFALVILLMLSVATPLATLFFRDSRSHFYPALLVYFVLLYPDLLKTLATSLQRFRLYGQSVFLSNTIAALLAVVLGGAFGPVAAVLGWGLGQLAGNFIIIRFARNQGLLDRFSFDRQVIPLWLGYGLPLFVLELANFLQTGMVSILAPWFSARAIGYFAFAYTFYGAVMLMPAAISTVLMPRVAQLRASGESVSARRILLSALAVYSVVAGVGVLATWFATDIFLVRFLPAYLPGAFMFKGIVSLAFVLGGVTIYRGYLAIVYNPTRLAALTLGSNTLTVIVSYLLLYSIA